MHNCLKQSRPVKGNIMDNLGPPQLQDSTVENEEIWTITFYRNYRHATTNTGPTTYGGNLASYPQATSTSSQPNLLQATVTLSAFDTQFVDFSFTRNSGRWFGKLTPQFVLDPQEEGGFVAYSNEYSGAVGQGETEEEAIQDLQEAILSLKEFLQEQEQENRKTR